jgi:two-component system CheB/CheR fusion protein
MQGYRVSVSELPSNEHLSSALSTMRSGDSLEAGLHSLAASQFSDEAVTVDDNRKPLALVVDDAPDLTEMLSVFLTHAGYEVITADSAKAAIEAAALNRFDVIISDIGMPQMNGYQLAQVLRSLPDYSAVPMIAVSGFSMFDDRERSLSSGFNAHVNKPIDPVGLFELIQQLRG